MRKSEIVSDFLSCTEIFISWLKFSLVISILDPLWKCTFPILDSNRFAVEGSSRDHSSKAKGAACPWPLPCSASHCFPELCSPWGQALLHLWGIPGWKSKAVPAALCFPMGFYRGKSWFWSKRYKHSTDSSASIVKLNFEEGSV